MSDRETYGTILREARKLWDMDQPDTPWSSSNREFYIFKAAHAAGREAGMREAAGIAESVQTTTWAGGDDWAAGYVDGKNAASAAILSAIGETKT